MDRLLECVFVVNIENCIAEKRAHDGAEINEEHRGDNEIAGEQDCRDRQQNRGWQQCVYERIAAGFLFGSKMAVDQNDNNCGDGRNGLDTAEAYAGAIRVVNIELRDNIVCAATQRNPAGEQNPECMPDFGVSDGVL